MKKFLNYIEKLSKFFEPKTLSRTLLFGLYTGLIITLPAFLIGKLAGILTTPIVSNIGALALFGVSFLGASAMKYFSDKKETKKEAAEYVQKPSKELYDEINPSKTVEKVKNTYKKSEKNNTIVEEQNKL